MNSADQEYFRLIDLVLTKGKWKKNRTGIDTIGAFGAQARYDLSEGFPLLTTKKVSFHNIAHELLWFLSGSTNIKYLVDNNVHIWDGNCYDKYRKKFLGFDIKNPSSLNDGSFGIHLFDKYFPKPEVKEWDGQLGYEGFGPCEQKEFIQRIKEDNEFAARWGELGAGTYGSMWRNFPYPHTYSYEDDNRESVYTVTKTVEKTVDQISKVINKLESNPDDRRLIVSAWHPYLVDHCALPPCHVMFQFHTEELDFGERMFVAKKLHGMEIWSGGSINCRAKMDAAGVPTRRLNCQLYQRSADLFLGVPYNIASYALLLSMVAQVVNMVPGEFIHSFGDIHLYENSIEAAKLQKSRQPYSLPKLELNTEVKNIFDFKFEDMFISNYEHHEAIKVEMAV